MSRHNREKDKDIYICNWGLQDLLLAKLIRMMGLVRKIMIQFIITDCLKLLSWAEYPMLWIWFCLQCLKVSRGEKKNIYIYIHTHTLIYVYIWCGMCVQSHQTLWDPMDSWPPGSSIHGILQARMLEWVAIFSSGGSSRCRNWTCFSQVSCIGRQILYHWTPWEAPRMCMYVYVYVHKD